MRAKDLYRVGAWALAAAVVGAVLPFVVTSATALSLMTQAVIYAIGTMGVAFLLRQNGLVSFGHAAYYGLGGYIVVLCQKFLGIPLGVGFVAAILVSGLFAFAVGLVIVRAPGVAFAMITLAIGQVFYLLVSKARGVTGGADGLVIELPHYLYGLPSSTFGKPGSMFLVCWLTLVCVLTALAVLLKTRFGPLTEAIRENEERARFIGYSTVVPRAAVHAISAMLCSTAGVLSNLYTGFASPESLHWSLSGSFLIAALIGGSSLLPGPVIGAVAYFLLRDLLSQETTHWLSILGVCLIVVVVFWPEGIAGGLERGVQRLRPKAEEPT